MKALVLQNEKLLVGLDGFGSLLQLVDKTTGRNYIHPAPGWPRPLFRLILTESDEKGNILPGEIVLDSTLAGRVEYLEHVVNRSLTIRFCGIDGLPLEAVCSISIDEDEPFSRWKMFLKNDTAFAVKAIEYPLVHCAYVLGESAHDDRILIPKHDGHLVGNPDLHPWEGDGIPRLDQRYHYPGEGRNTPGGMSVQLIAYYDRDGGLYMATHDDQGHPKILGPRIITGEDERYFDFSPAHLYPEIAGLSVGTNYETVIGLFWGDWQDAADIYKRWAVHAPWCAKRTFEREDIPDWIKRGAFFFNFRLRHQPDGESFLDRVPEYLERWRDALGMPLVAMMCGWEKIGEWTGPDYFPPYGGDQRFRRMCERLKERGFRPFPFGLSGLKLPVRKKIPASGPQPELAVDYDARRQFEQACKAAAATKPGGDLILESDVSQWDGLHAYACPTTPQAEKQLYDASMKLVRDYGAQISQADQLFNGAVTECYNAEHPHPPGRGIWQNEAIRSIYRRIREDGKKRDPDFALSQEWQSELFLQDLDVYHARNYDQPRGLMGVPLFSYLYHEYLPCYGGDWSSFLSDNTNGVYYHAANFVNGNLPAGCPQSMKKMTRNAEPEEADEAILRMARHTCRLFSAYTDFLVLGKMLKTPALQIEGETIKFVGVNFGFGKGPLTVPSVLHRAWQAPDGRVAYAMANVTDKTRQFHLVVEPYAGRKADLWLNVNGLERTCIARSLPLPNAVEITLNPGDAAMLECLAVT
jgi:hypothetical protein